ncbi:hypothetical protein SH601_05100 [Gracilibacillus sp. S3-1-1]|uniref:Uncharacterized protein n=1 Tax=Gracilibacillus pellucidus TaxID=3095368 RepID=A0ACC6M391_9BACI|nr:hypothetical protein [Gracilibacillus sp. S3-1-1]MDX8045361.1 hypothetical protein [Gracilibacillus sp. S3-1-1]
MGRLSERFIKIWLAIPRWFGKFLLSAITIYVFWTYFINGLKNIFTVDTKALVVSLVVSGMIIFLYNKAKKAESE